MRPATMVLSISRPMNTEPSPHRSFSRFIRSDRVFFAVSLTLHAYFCFCMLEKWQHFSAGEQTTGTIVEVSPPPSGAKGGRLMAAYQTENGASLVASTGYTYGYKKGDKIKIIYRKDQNDQFIIGDLEPAKHKDMWAYGTSFAIHLLIAVMWLSRVRD